MTVLWFFELGRGVWNAFRGHTQRGLNHAQPTKQIYTANWFYLYCSQFRSKNKQKPWQTQILQKRHRFSTKDPKAPRACRRYPRTQRPLRLIVTIPRNPRIPIAGFIYPDFTTKEKILDYPDTVSFLRDSRYPDSGFWTLGIIIWVYIVYGHCTMTKQLPRLNAIICHASVWINLKPVVISDPVDSPPRSHYIWPKKDDIARIHGFLFTSQCD